MHHAEGLIETKSLACVAEEMEKQAVGGEMITYATDSTTNYKGKNGQVCCGWHLYIG